MMAAGKVWTNGNSWKHSSLEKLIISKMAQPHLHHGIYTWDLSQISDPSRLPAVPRKIESMAIKFPDEVAAAELSDEQFENLISDLTARLTTITSGSLKEIALWAGCLLTRASGCSNLARELARSTVADGSAVLRLYGGVVTAAFLDELVILGPVRTLVIDGAVLRQQAFDTLSEAIRDAKLDTLAARNLLLAAPASAPAAAAAAVATAAFAAVPTAAAATAAAGGSSRTTRSSMRSSKQLEHQRPSKQQWENLLDVACRHLQKVDLRRCFIDETESSSGASKKKKHAPAPLKALDSERLVQSLRHAQRLVGFSIDSESLDGMGHPDHVDQAKQRISHVTSHIASLEYIRLSDMVLRAGSAAEPNLDVGTLVAVSFRSLCKTTHWPGRLVSANDVSEDDRRRFETLVGEPAKADEGHVWVRTLGDPAASAHLRGISWFQVPRGAARPFAESLCVARDVEEDPVRARFQSDLRAVLDAAAPEEDELEEEEEAPLSPATLSSEGASSRPAPHPPSPSPPFSPSLSSPSPTPQT
eukprot:tig00000093_g3531.t1